MGVRRKKGGAGRKGTESAERTEGAEGAPCRVFSPLGSGTLPVVTKPRQLLGILARYVLAPLLAVLVVFEEWGWVPLSRAMAQLARLPLWARMEDVVRRLPPYAALLVFTVPMLTLVPLKLLAWYWISQGHAVLGLAVVVAAKLLGTAIAARLFQLTHPTLMQLPWFRRAYSGWKVWKDALLLQVRQSIVWRVSRAITRRAKGRAQRGWRLLRSAFINR